MSMTMKGQVAASLGWSWRDLTGTLPIVDADRLEAKVDLTSGAGEGECNAVWHASGVSLALNESVTYQLDQLPLMVFHGQITIPMVSVKAVLIANRSDASGGYLLVGAAPTNEWFEPFGAYGDTVNVMQGSPMLIANTLAGWDVTSTSNQLQLQSLGGPVTFDIAILGVMDDGSSSSSSSSS